MGGRWMEDLAQCFVGRQAKPAVGPNSQQDTNTHTHTHTDMGYEFYHDSLNHSSPDHAAISRGHVYLERQQRQVHKETLAGTYSNYSNGPAFTTDVCFFNSNSGASGAEWWMSICLCTIQDVNDTQALFTPLLASRALLIYCMSFMLENSVCFLLCAIKKAATSKAPHGHVLYCTHVLVLFHPSPLSSSFLEVDKLLFCWTNFCLSTMETETPGHVKYVEHMDPLEFNTHNLLERSLPAWKVDHTVHSRSVAPHLMDLVIHTCHMDRLPCVLKHHVLCYETKADRQNRLFLWTNFSQWSSGHWNSSLMCCFTRFIAFCTLETTSP